MILSAEWISIQRLLPVPPSIKAGPTTSVHLAAKNPSTRIPRSIWARPTNIRISTKSHPVHKMTRLKSGSFYLFAIGNFAYGTVPQVEDVIWECSLYDAKIVKYLSNFTNQAKEV